MGTTTLRDIESVDVGASDHFPSTPTGELNDLSRRAQEVAGSLIGWSEPDATIDVAQLRATYEQCRAAVLAEGGSAVGHVRSHDGMDMIVQADALDADRRRSILNDGGGLLLESAERFSAPLNRMCGHLAVARGARVSALALFGSEPTRVLGPQVRRTLVLAAGSDVVVHPDGGAPFELRAGHCATAEGMPRIVAGPDSFTVLLVESAFTPLHRHSMVLDRAARHPLLRLDAPLELAEPVDVYGSSEPVRYVDLVAGEVDLLLSNSPDDLLEWWWVISRRLPPFAIPGSADRVVVRGRFPGGVGTIENDEHLILKGAGVTFAVPEHHRELLADLLGGDTFECAVEGDRYRSVCNLAAAGAIEFVG